MSKTIISLELLEFRITLDRALLKYFPRENVDKIDLNEFIFASIKNSLDIVSYHVPTATEDYLDDQTRFKFLVKLARGSITPEAVFVIYNKSLRHVLDDLEDLILERLRRITGQYTWSMWSIFLSSRNELFLVNDGDFRILDWASKNETGTEYSRYTEKQLKG